MGLLTHGAAMREIAEMLDSKLWWVVICYSAETSEAMGLIEHRHYKPGTPASAGCVVTLLFSEGSPSIFFFRKDLMSAEEFRQGLHDVGGESPLMDQIGEGKDLMVLVQEDGDHQRSQVLMAEMNRWVLALRAERN